MNGRQTMFRKLLIIMVLIFLFIVGCNSKTLSKDKDVLAVVGNENITLEEFEKELENIPPYAQARFKGEQGRREFLDRMVQTELLYVAAENNGYASNEEVIKQLEEIKRQLMIQEYYKAQIQAKSDPTEEETRAFYEGNKDSYSIPKQLKARHILCKEKYETDAAKRRILAGESFEDVAIAVSIDKATASRGGYLGFCTEGKPLPYLGEEGRELSQPLFNAKVNELTDVIKTSLGYHIAIVEEIREERIKPFEEVRSNIEMRLRQEKTNTIQEELFEELRITYKVNVNDDLLHASYLSTITPEDVTPEMLYNKAQNARTPQEALAYYEQILREFPKDDNAYKAQFMIGFVYSEQLEESERAKLAFEKVIKNYPNSDLVEDAKWMLENAEQKSFENLEDIQKEVDSEK